MVIGQAKRVLAVVAISTSIAGCASQQSPATSVTAAPQTLHVYATTSTMPLLHDLTTSYNEAFPIVQFKRESLDFQMALNRLVDDKIDFFLSNHLPQLDSKNDMPLWAAPIGQDGIAIIVHPDTEIKDLSTDQLRAIFQGRIQNWNALNPHNEQEIVVYTREINSGTHAEFTRQVMGFRQITPGAFVTTSAENLIESVRQKPGSIGYVSAGADLSSVNVITVDGIAPTQRNIREQRYPLRSTVFVIGKTEPLDEFRTFINWIQSEQGQKIVGLRFASLNN